MSELYNKVVLVPDIVFYLNKRIKLKFKSPKDCIGICLRDDKKSFISKRDKSIIYSALKAAGLKTEKLTMISNFYDLYLNESERQAALQEKLQQFSCYKCIITDRLHGVIFSVLAGVSCLAIDNSNQKISGVLETIGNYLPVQIIKQESLKDVPAKIAILVKESAENNSWKIDIDNIYSELEDILKRRNTA